MEPLDGGAWNNHGRPISHIGSSGINSALPEKIIIRLIATTFNEMRFYENAFPQKAFPQNVLHKILSTKCRKILMGIWKECLGYSFFLWGILHGIRYLISLRNSLQPIYVFKYLLSPPTHNRVPFVLPSLNPVKELLHGTGKKGGGEGGNTKS